MILSHLSGIRHYEKDAKKVKEDKVKAQRLLKPPVKEKEDEKNCSENKGKPTAEKNKKRKEFEHEEYYLKDNFESVLHALDLFKDDPLIFEPGKAQFKNSLNPNVFIIIITQCFMAFRHHFFVLHPCLYVAECRCGAGCWPPLPGRHDEHVP